MNHHERAVEYGGKDTDMWDQRRRQRSAWRLAQEQRLRQQTEHLAQLRRHGQQLQADSQVLRDRAEQVMEGARAAAERARQLRADLD